MSTEFEQLFRACWFGESPWEALGDWALEEGRSFPVQASVEYAKTGNFPHVVNLHLFVPRGEPRSLLAIFTDFNYGVNQSRLLHRDSFAAGFPVWIRNEIEALKNVLRRNSYQ